MHLPGSVVQAIGFVAAAGTTCSLLPQIRRIYRLRSARDVSYGMFAIFSVGVALWLLYGMLVHSWPVIVANAVTLTFSLAVLALKRKFDAEHAARSTVSRTHRE